MKTLVQKIIKSSCQHLIYGTSQLTRCRVIEAQRHRALYEFQVCEDDSNDSGAVHGGCLGTLLDTISMFTLVSTTDKSNVWHGFSVVPTPQGEKKITLQLNMRFLDAAFVGDVLRIDSQVVHTGYSTARVEMLVNRLTDGKPVFQGTMTAFRVPPAGESRAAKPVS